MVRLGEKARKVMLDDRIELAMKQRYAKAIAQVKIPPEGLPRRTRREQVAEQLKKLGIENEYVAYAIASRLVK